LKNFVGTLGATSLQKNEIQKQDIEKNILDNSEVNIFKINKDDYSIKNIPPQHIVESVKGLIDGI